MTHPKLANIYDCWDECRPMCWTYVRNGMRVTFTHGGDFASIKEAAKGSWDDNYAYSSILNELYPSYPSFKN